jgi:hypothetical protein
MQPAKNRLGKAVARVLCSLLLTAGALSPSQVVEAAQTLWQLQLDGELRGRIYQTGIVSGKSPIVIATTPDQVLQITAGRPSQLFALLRNGEIGQSALLPEPLATTLPQGGMVGLLRHRHHDVEGFALVDFSGKQLAEVKDARHAHYRLAPDGQSFVGIDTGHSHTGTASEAVVYRFFDAKGRPLDKDGIRSVLPQPADSAYTPDGKGFLINSQQTGLSAYDTTDMRQQWTIPEAVRFFAPANGDTDRVVVSPADDRQEAALYEASKSQWRLHLQEAGIVENIRNVAISPRGDLIAVSSAHHLLILGPGSSTPLGVFEVGTELAINSVAVSDRGVVAVGAQQARLQEDEKAVGAAYLLDSKGEVLFQQDTVHERSNAWIPMVQFDATGQFLLLRTLEQMWLIDVESVQ